MLITRLKEVAPHNELNQSVGKGSGDSEGEARTVQLSGLPSWGKRTDKRGSSTRALTQLDKGKTAALALPETTQFKAFLSS